MANRRAASRRVARAPLGHVLHVRSTVESGNKRSSRGDARFLLPLQSLAVVRSTFDDRRGTAMIELAAPPARATAAPTVDHDRLDHVISLVAAGDRAAFRRLYAFMAMRVWRIVAEAPLGPADAVAVTRSTFVEVWHSARAATHYDARDWMATVTTGRVNDRLHLVDASGRHHPHRTRRLRQDRRPRPGTRYYRRRHPGGCDGSPLINRVATRRSASHATKMRRNPVYIDKAGIISVLRSRGLNARADWVDRELPEFVDTYKNAALLRMLGVDPAGISPAQVVSRQG